MDNGPAACQKHGQGRQRRMEEKETKIGKSEPATPHERLIQSVTRERADCGMVCANTPPFATE